MSGLPPDDLPRRREWVDREILAHIDEMLPYWLGEIERVIASPVEPVPFGREQTDLVRTLTVDRDRTLPVSELYARLDNSLERVLRRLLELDERQVARRGLDKRRGQMTVRQIVDTMLAGHLEEHCSQMAAALDTRRAVRA
ncbi:MAG: DinB family protein [Candidatus Limnocylindrales bacterium]